MAEKVYARNLGSGIVSHVPDWYLTREPFASRYEPAAQEDYQCLTCGVPPETSAPVLEDVPDEYPVLEDDESVSLVN